MAVKLWIVVFWFVMPYRFVDDNQNFKRMYLNVFFDDKKVTCFSKMMVITCSTTLHFSLEDYNPLSLLYSVRFYPLFSLGPCSSHSPKVPPEVQIVYFKLCEILLSFMIEIYVLCQVKYKKHPVG
jgi:hypothetical protein